jgi:hypothetical protein
MPRAPSSRRAASAIGVVVAARLERRQQADGLVLAVERDRHDRHARGDGDAIEAALPRLGARARARRRDGEKDRLRLVDRLHGLRHHALGRFAVHRNAAEPAHQPADSRPEQRVLGDEACADADGEHREDADDEVPVGGVRRDDHHQLRPRRELAIDAPSRGAEEGA